MRDTSIKAAADAGVKQFVFMSVHDYKAPSFVRRVGYFDGKRRTEKIIGELFGAKVMLFSRVFHVQGGVFPDALLGVNLVF